MTRWTSSPVERMQPFPHILLSRQLLESRALSVLGSLLELLARKVTAVPYLAEALETGKFKIATDVTGRSRIIPSVT